MVENEISIIMQARMGSERLPGKVLRVLQGKSLLGHIITRMSHSKLAKDIIVATTTNSEDDSIEEECAQYDIKCFRGSDGDVLGRFYNAAMVSGVKNIMRFCCDNPFADGNVADRAIEIYNTGNFDYVNTNGLPLGVGVEIFSFSWLEKAHKEGLEPYQREHVTPYIIDNAINKGAYKSDRDYSNYRLTVDEEKDWEFAQAIYEKLYQSNPLFTYLDVIALLLKEPEIRNINAGVMQKPVK